VVVEDTGVVLVVVVIVEVLIVVVDVVEVVVVIELDIANTRLVSPWAVNVAVPPPSLAVVREKVPTLDPTT